jgi:hypothetical protein
MNRDDRPSGKRISKEPHFGTASCLMSLTSVIAVANCLVFVPYNWTPNERARGRRAARDHRRPTASPPRSKLQPVRCGDCECDQRSNSERFFGCSAWRECLIIAQAIPEHHENTYHVGQTQHDDSDNERQHRRDFFLFLRARRKIACRHDGCYVGRGGNGASGFLQGTSDLPRLQPQLEKPAKRQSDSRVHIPRLHVGCQGWCRHNQYGAKPQQFNKINKTHQETLEI